MMSKLNSLSKNQKRKSTQKNLFLSHFEINNDIKTELSEEKKYDTQKVLSGPEITVELGNTSMKPGLKVRRDLYMKKGTTVAKAKKEAKKLVDFDDETPSVKEIGENFGLNDVNLDYSDADYHNLTTYEMFHQTYRSRIQSYNPKVRDFCLMSALLFTSFRFN